MILDDLRRIRFQTFIFILEVTEDSELVVNKASMFRGGIGEMLLRKHCLRDRNCDTCDFCDECVVRNVFYHPMKVRPDFVQGKENTGYIIECDDHRKHLKAGNRIELLITLFGNVVIHFPSIMDAVYMLGQSGVGADKVHYEVLTIQNLAGKTIMQNNQVYLRNAAPQTLGDYTESRLDEYKDKNDEIDIRMEIISPCTIKRDGEFHYEFDDGTLVNGIYRRIYLLSCFEGNEISQYYGSEDDVKILEQNTNKITVTRFSSTHDSKLYLTGFIGELRIRVKRSFLPYLISGEILHIGKNTAMGFGKYRIHPG